ncbi:MAG: WD40 repeat domain-containing protein, partial [Pirellulaceae bacterium]
DWLISGSNDGFARIREFPSGDVVAEFQHEQPVQHVHVLDDGQSVMVGTWGGPGVDPDSLVVRWQMDQPETPIATHELPSHGDLVRFSSDDAFMLITGRVRVDHDSFLKVWDLNGDPELEREPVTLDLESPIREVQFVDNGDQFIVVRGDGQIQTCTSRTGDQLKVARTGIETACARLQPGGNRVALGNVGNQVTVWDLLSQQTICSPLLHANRIQQTSFSANGRYLMSFGQDGFVKIWDIQSSTNEATFRDGDLIVDYLLSDTEKTAAVANQAGRVTLLSMPEGASTEIVLLHDDDEIVLSAAFAPGGRQLSSCGTAGIVKLWDVATGELLTDQMRADDELQLVNLEFTPDGKFLLSFQYVVVAGNRVDTQTSGKVLVWDVASRQRVAELTHPQLVIRIVVSPDSRLAATICMDRAVRVWNLYTGQLLGMHVLRDRYVQDCEFNADNDRLIISGGDQQAFAWNFATGEVETGPLDHGAVVRHAMFHPIDGNPVTATANGEVFLWGPGSDPALRKIMRTWGSSVDQIGFDATGQLLFTGSSGRATTSPDRRLAGGAGQIWDTRTGEMAGPLFLSANGINNNNLLFGNSADFLSIADNVGNVITWQLPREQRSLEHVRDLCEVLSGHRIDDNSSLVPLKASEFLERWQRLRESNTMETSSASFSPLPAPQ